MIGSGRDTRLSGRVGKSFGASSGGLMIRVHSRARRSSLVNSVKFVELPLGLCAYELETEETVDVGEGKSNHKNRSEGICKRDNLEKFMEGKASELIAVSLTKEMWGQELELTPLVLSKEALEMVRTVPWGQREEFWDHFDQSSVLTKLADGDEFVLFSTGRNMFFDADFQPCPVSIRFDEYSGGMSNESYDLDRVVDALRARDDIHYAGPSPRPTLINRLNQRPGRTHKLRFWWQPNRRDYQKIWDWVSEFRGDHHWWSDLKYRAIFELDLLGLRAAGAAKHETFYPPEGDSNE